jgi:hypothetical protein
MKKRFLQLGIVGVLAASGWLGYISYEKFETKSELNATLVSTEGEEEEEENENRLTKQYESQGISDYYKWIRSQKIDPATGNINMDAFYTAWAQTKAAKAAADVTKTASAATLVMESLGPTNQGGRTRSVLCDKNNPNIIYAASVGGGIYRSTTGGSSWFPVNGLDALNAMPMASFTQDSEGHIYVGTGEKLVNGSCLGGMSGAIDGADALPGNGIYKSTDSGLSFQVIPSTEAVGTGVSTTAAFAFTMKMASKTGSKGIFAATNSGLRYSSDGNTFTVIPGMTGSFYDVDVATDDVVYAIKDPALVYKSTDGGASFTLIPGTSGMPSSGVRKELSVSPQDPNYVYVVNVQSCTGCLEGVYQSTDGSVTFTTIGEGGSSTFDPMSNSLQCQGTYDLAIAVDPANKNRVFVAGVGMWSWSSTNGWNQMTNFNADPTSERYVHADIQNLYFHPTNPNILYIACDGGVHRSSNASNLLPNFTQLNNLMATTQAYHMAASWKGYVASGNQDNGTQLVDYQQNRPFDAYEGKGGDGGYVEFSRLKAGGVIAETPGGEIDRSSNNGIAGSFGSIWTCRTDSIGGPANGSQTCLPDGILDAFPQTSSNPTATPNNPFVQPFLLWENWARPANDDTSLFFVAATASGTTSKIFMNPKIMDFGLSLTPPDFVIGIAPIATVSHFQMSADGKRLYVAGTSGTVVRFDNVNTGPYPITPVTIGNFGRFTTLAVDKTNDGVDNLCVFLGGYVTSSDGVWYGANAQAMPTSLSNSNFIDKHNTTLPSMPIYSGILDANIGSKKAVIGTDQGVWMTNDITAASPTWELQNTSIGEVATYCVRQEPMNSPTCFVLYFGTHGRGMWRSTTLTPSSCASQVVLPLNSATSIAESASSNLECIHIYPNPIATNGNIAITLKESELITISIKDLTGKTVSMVGTQNLSVGTSTLPIDVANLANGTYIVAITNNNRTIGSSKLVVVH